MPYIMSKLFNRNDATLIQYQMLLKKPFGKWEEQTYIKIDCKNEVDLFFQKMDGYQ